MQLFIELFYILKTINSNIYLIHLVIDASISNTRNTISIGKILNKRNNHNKKKLIMLKMTNYLHFSSFLNFKLIKTYVYKNTFFRTYR